MSLYNVIGTYTPSELLSDPIGADIIAVPMKPGNGEVPRGTIVYRDTDGMYVPATEDEAIDDYMLAVLDEAVDTDANTTIAENARAFRAGRLIADKVTLTGGDPVTAAIALTLRKQGIVLNPINGAEGFDNELSAGGA